MSTQVARSETEQKDALLRCLLTRDESGTADLLVAMDTEAREVLGRWVARSKRFFRPGGPEREANAERLGIELPAMAWY